MDTYDVRTALPDLYAPKAGRFTIVDVPTQAFLAVDGQGDPNVSEAYAAAVSALYAVAYGVKFASKADGRNLVVAPLEGLWRADDMSAFTGRDKQAWQWTMLISQPSWITPGVVDAAVSKAGAKKDHSSALGSVRLTTLSEGRSVQTLHIGSYDDEAPVLHRLHHEFMPEHGLTFAGDHHEIYLSDPRRTAPERLRTVLRQPVS